MDMLLMSSCLEISDTSEKDMMLPEEIRREYRIKIFIDSIFIENSVFSKKNSFRIFSRYMCT